MDNICELRYRRVKTLDDALIVREIRNQCRRYMTRDRRIISIFRQTKWWRSLNHEEVQVYLFLENRIPIGYGLIRREDRYLLTGGLIREYRGKGIGTYIFLFLERQLARKTERVTVEVLVNNERALKLYKKLGYKEQSRRNGTLTMTKEL